ncbi:diacylglycerol kinase family lipid kinase [Anaerolineales bacterium HSG6]|nr:diacylglycerol kinase family lipid kinase [Anaerolineales bacterium HSG6]MDM8531259.1 diacylglycerol kinase family lipid kinase [Anaerolineales bacterium HSG25]
MKVLFIVNPKSGFSGFRKQVGQAIAHLAEFGYLIKRVETGGPGDATKFAQQAIEEGYDIAVAVGGDGTINEVVNGLAGSKTALAVLPAGTANVYAADVGIPIGSLINPDAIKKAVDVLATGQRRRIDLGRLTLTDGTSRHFLMWSGVGLDAAISEAKKSNTSSSRSLGYVSWFIATMMLLFEFRGNPATLEMDDETIDERLIVAVASNGQLYGRVWRLAPEAKMDDGLLDVGVMVGHRWWQILKHGISLSLRRHVHDPDFHLHRTKSLTIRTKYPMPVHVDGETVGNTPITIEVVPAALDVIVPDNAPGRLFKDGNLNGESNKKGRLKWPSLPLKRKKN